MTERKRPERKPPEVKVTLSPRAFEWLRRHMGNQLDRQQILPFARLEEAETMLEVARSLGVVLEFDNRPGLTLEQELDEAWAQKERDNDRT